MSFLQPLLLIGLPLALIPIIIHLIHMKRRRRVMWAATMFLKAAQRMNKGLSKLRQYLILTLRMLAVAALIFVVGRPLAGGLLGLTGGAPASVIILLDRSASMEQQLLATGVSKRAAALQNLTAAVRDAYGDRSRLTLIDSATLQPVAVESVEALPDLPQAGPTDTAADVPRLMQAALDYITTNETGRTDVWLVSDLRRSDWNAGGGRWEALRSAFSSLQGVRFQVLAYPEAPASNHGIIVERVVLQDSSGQPELLLNARFYQNHPTDDPESAASRTLPVRVLVNGTATTLDAELRGPEFLLQGQAIPIDRQTTRGWGRVELPADANPGDNVYHFVFDEPLPLKSVVVSEDSTVSDPLRAALTARAEPGRAYACTVLPAARAAEIVWEETALIVWQAPLPDEDNLLGKQLSLHVRAGRGLVFLPPENPDATTFDGLRWTDWQSARPGEPVQPEWWRNDTKLLSNTRAGTALPVGDLTVQRWCGVEGERIPLARLGDKAENAPFLIKATHESGKAPYFLTALPGSGQSSLARDGIVFFALLHRALNDGAASLGNALQRSAGSGALGDEPMAWKRLDAVPGGPAEAETATILTQNQPLLAGVLEKEAAESDDLSTLVALNRPPGEDAPQTLAQAELGELFEGLEWRLIERSLENEKSLASEIWRLFLLAMAAAIVVEALLCLPGRREQAEPEWRGAMS